MSTIVNYRVIADWFEDAEVHLQVDLDVLTPELATKINTFWSCANDRLENEGGDVVRAVVRLFGACAIRFFMQNGGADARASNEVSRIWTADVIKDQYEGWPSLDGLGILITSVYAPDVCFEDVRLEVV